MTIATTAFNAFTKSLNTLFLVFYSTVSLEKTQLSGHTEQETFKSLNKMFSTHSSL